MRKFFVNLFIFVASSIVALVLLEFAVRVLFPWYDPARQVVFFANADGVPLGKPHKVFRQRTPKGDYDLLSRFNKYGFRDEKDLANSRDGDIFVLGDSFSFGWGIQDGQRYSDQLEKILQRPVYNISIPGDLKTYQKLLQYARNRGAHVSILILGLCMENDLWDYATRDSFETTKGMAKSQGFYWRGFVKSHSAVYLAFSYELQKIPVIRRLLEKTGFARDLERLVNKNVLDEKVLVSSRDEIMKIVGPMKSAVVLIIPSRMLWVGEHHDTELAVHERLIALLQSEGVRVIDMKPYFEKKGHPLDYYFKTDPHWNAEGHALAGKVLAEYFNRRGGP